MDESTFEYMNLAPVEEHAALHGHAPSAAPYVKATTVRAREEAPLVKRSPSWGASFKHLVQCSYVNWLLVFLPVSPLPISTSPFQTPSPPGSQRPCEG